jgi:lipopolysaccharide export system ATP-binding protein
MSPTLHARDLCKRFGTREAVRDVRLAVGPGEVCRPAASQRRRQDHHLQYDRGPRAADLGASPRRRGDHRSADVSAARKGITYLPQEPSIFRKLTVEENILAILETLPLGRRERKERAHELLAELDLVPKRKQKGATLSGGERRRVEITRALVLDPRFMLLDEPFSGIDPIAVIDIQKIIAQLRERGIGIVITDHNVRETLSICDRAYIIKDGRIIREGAPAEITEDPTVREIYLGQNFRL